MRSIEDIANDIESVKNQIYDEAMKWKEIDEKSGEEIIALVSSTAFQVIGIPIQLPKELGYASLGILGIGLTILKRKRLKPIAEKLKSLEKQHNVLVNEYEKVSMLQQSETLEGGLDLEGLKKIGERNAGTPDTTTTAAYWAVGILFLLACYIYFKNKRLL